MKVLSTVLRRDDDLDRYFASALDLHERIEARYLTALTQLDWAAALTQRQQAGDAERSNTLTAAARDAAAHFGFQGLARRAG